MKFSLKLKSIAAAIGLLAVAQSSNAALFTNDANTGNSDFMFFAIADIFDGANFGSAGYAITLNKRLDDIINVTPNQVFNLTGLNGFINTLNTSYTTTNLEFGVLAADNVKIPGANGFKGFRIATSFDTAKTEADIDTLSGAVKSSANALNNYANQTQFSSGPVISFDKNDDTNINKVFGGSWQSYGPYSAIALVEGATVSEWLLSTPTTGSPGAPSATTKVKYGDFQVSLANQTLTYAPAAPVPVPAALWLLGSALVGVTGIRRRQA